MRSFALLAALSFAALSPLATGCSSSPDEVSTRGSLELPLVKNLPDGSLYRLTNASFEITSVDGVKTVEASNLDTLSLQLSPGLASVRLLPGWVLEKYSPSGSIPEVLPAVLGTANPAQLRVLANFTAQVKFGFIVRSTSGTVNVDFGVTTDPRQFAGGLRVTTATGDFAPYAPTPRGARFDFAIFFELNQLSTRVRADGAKERQYAAGENGLPSSPVVAEFYNDPIGTFADTIGPSLAAASLTYQLAGKADGTTELSGSLSGFVEPYTTLDFGPYTLRDPLAVDAAGFPADIFFHDDSVPFKLVTFFESGEATMEGFLNLRHIP